MIFTMLLVWAVLYTATAKASEDNHFFGWAIGGSIVVAAIVGGGISGGAFNPGVAVGAHLIKLFSGNTDLIQQTLPCTSYSPPLPTGAARHVQYIWIYLTAPYLGWVLAAIAFWLSHPDTLPFVGEEQFDELAPAAYPSHLDYHKAQNSPYVALQDLSGNAFGGSPSAQHSNDQSQARLRTQSPALPNPYGAGSFS
eukprot:gene4813-4973_t